MRAASARLIPLGLALVVALGLTVRFLHAPVGGGLTDIDADLHLRRAQTVVTAGARTLLQPDPMLSWPDGATVNWPPGFDWLLAGVVRAVPADAVDRVAGALAALIGALGLLGGYALARTVLSAPAALGATLATALLPGHVEYTRVGAVDHHVFESLLLWTTLAGLLHAARSSGRRAAALAIGAGLALAADFAISPTAQLRAALAVAVALWLARRAVRGPALALGTAALATGALVAACGRLGRLQVDELTALQPLLLGGAALSAAASGRLRPGGPRLVLFAIAGATAVLVLAASGALGGVVHFAGRRGIIGTVVETRGLFAFGLAPALAPLTAMVLLVPLAALVALLRRGADDARVALVFVALALFVVTLQQRRFMHLCALPAAIVLVDAAGALATTRRRTALLALAAAAGAWPSLGYYRTAPVDTSPRHDAVRALADYLGTLPRGGVLAQWPYGHVITRFAGQPVVASPLLTPATEPAVLAATRTLLDDDPVRALAAIDARRVRWVIATALPPGVTQRYLDALGDPRPAAEVAARALVTRLDRDDGDGVPGLRERARAPGGAAVLFERVPGARVEGLAPPGSTVTAELPLAQGARRFVTHQRTLADANGRFVVRLPYPTEPDPAVPVHALGPWQLSRTGQPPQPLSVSAAAVAAGLPIPLVP